MEDLPDAFAAMGAELEAVQKRIARLHRRLAESPSVDDERKLDALREARDEKLTRWAMLALEWRFAGGGIELRPGEAPLDAPSVPPPSVSAAPPPAPPLDPHEGAARTAEPPLVEPEAPDDSEDDDMVDLSIIDSLVLGSANWSHETFDPGFSIEALHEIILRLGPPRDNLSHDELLAEAAVLDTELTRISRWGQFPRAIQRSLLGLVACRMRRLQDDTPSAVRVVLELQLRRGFARLTQFSSEYQPGWVTGLSRQHKPESDSWLSDAQYWWNTLQRELGSLAIEQQKATLNPEVSLNDLRGILDAREPDADRVKKATNRALRSGVAPEDPRLVRLLEPHLKLISGDKNLKRVRRAIRVRAPLEGDLGSMDELLEPPREAWPFYARTRDKQAVLVGGETREQRRAAIQEALGFAELEWVNGYEVRTVQSLAERIENGAVGFVILLGRFINHKVTDLLLPACNASDTDWVMVRQGYGINQIKQAIERYLGDRAGRGDDATI